jgi:hypothetical protein
MRDIGTKAALMVIGLVAWSVLIVAAAWLIGLVGADAAAALWLVALLALLASLISRPNDPNDDLLSRF